MRIILLVLRWASIVGFFVIVWAVVYGVYQLKRMRRNQETTLSASQKAMVERSEQITTALTEMQKPKELKDGR